MAKNKMKPRRNLPFRHVFVFSVLMFIGVTVWGLWIINQGIKPVLMNIAETKTRQIAQYGINYGIKKKEVNEMKKYLEEQGIDSLIKVEKNDNDEITNINLNTYIINKLQAGTTQDVQEYLRSIEEGTRPIYNTSDQIKIVEEEKGVIAHIPLGQATNNVLLSNLGPQVPVKFEVLSNTRTNIKRVMQQLGINNVYVEISLHVEVDVQVVIPVGTKPITVKTDIPLVSFLYPGKVPMYWSSGSGNGASITLPDKSETKTNEIKKNQE
ncbi:MAG: sporulation protein YunB [Tuberibacillus sp.]